MHYQSKLIYFYNQFAKKVYPYIPFTYYWYLINTAGKEGKDILDLGCGWGEPMEVLQSAHRRDAHGVDIFPAYLKQCRDKGIYKTLTKANLITYKPAKKYDIIFCSHVLEHFTKKDGKNFLNRIIKNAKKKVIVTVPIGDLPQDEYDENKYQKHLSEWYPQEFEKLGFKVIGITPRFIFGTHDRVRELRFFALFLFIFAYILQPFYAKFPNKCIYMLCVKTI